MAEPGINYTENYNLAKPEQGYKNWGTPWNENADKIDAALKDVKTPGNIGDIKYSVLTEVPPGGAWCDGAEYTKTAFPDLYQMLVDGKLQKTDYATFDSSVSANGSCGFFALNTASQKFKVPLLKDIYIKAGDTPLAFGEESLPNITGELGGLEGSEFYTSGAFSIKDTTKRSGGAAGGQDCRASFDASLSSPTYQDGAKVNPDHVVYRAYVVLYSSAAEASEAQAAEFMTALGGKANVALDNVAPAQSFKDMSVGWGMPDYDSGITVTSFPFTAPTTGVISLCAICNNQEVAYLVNGNYVSSINSADSIAGGSFILVSTNDVVSIAGDGNPYYTTVNGAKNVFYPIKGVDNA